jgi:uncharacterized protein YbjT (DUF2867 family)
MSVRPRILVTGATGNIGREIIAQLGKAGVPAPGVSRNPQEAPVVDGIEVVRGDHCAQEIMQADNRSAWMLRDSPPNWQ